MPEYCDITGNFLFMAIIFNTNLWNRIRYTMLAPIYDIAAFPLRRGRRRSIALLDIRKGEKVLLVGAGTGLDLEVLPADADVLASDLTPAMLGRMRKRIEKRKMTARAVIMDGQDLPLPSGSFDKIVLHLILAVIPDPVACLREAERVLRPGGRIAVYDKFLPHGQEAGLGRRALNFFTSMWFSDINRRFASIHRATQLRVVHEEEAGFGGNFKVFILEKPLLPS